MMFVECEKLHIFTKRAKNKSFTLIKQSDKTNGLRHNKKLKNTDSEYRVPNPLFTFHNTF